MEAADACAIPGGKALVVDVAGSRQNVTSAILGEGRIRVVREEKKDASRRGRSSIVATGPLTSPGLAERIMAMTGGANLHFFDAISPIIEADEHRHVGRLLRIPLRRGATAAIISTAP